MAETRSISIVPGRGESLRAQIYEDLREKLRGGAIGPGDRLVDVSIARSLGVSRMPVREALTQLVSEGHLVSTTRGFALPELAPEDIADIFEVRRLLEPRAAANAARDLSEADLDRLEAAVASAEAAVAAGDVRLLAEANAVFRATWIASLRNTRLAGTIERFADQVHVVRRETLRDAGTRDIVLEGMRGIYAAFRARDALAAQDRMTRFMHDAEQSYARLNRGEDCQAIGETGLEAADG
ncbi:MAG: GntR family transcriptional regulator [Pararhodobacter sp.]|nr:GntR family transcriptional regulator [Pararhodobacter sp.]